MDLWGHINELRKRLFWALIAFAVACVATFNLAPTFINILAVPVGGIDKLLSIEVTENLGVCSCASRSSAASSFRCPSCCTN